MLMPENIKELIKTLLKNNLITIKEIAILKANKKEDRDELIALVQRLYENREVKCGDVAAILVNEDDILDLLDYITSEPINVSPITVIPDFPGVKTVPLPYVPSNVPNTDPWPYPYRQDIIYCQQTPQNTIKA